MRHWLRMVSAGWICLVLVGNTAKAQEASFSVSMFHFNVQYVAGGLKGFPSGDNPSETMDFDEAQTEDLIIRQSFEPVLDLFLKHPDWGVDLEMQAYMVEILAERHPDVLEKLQQLVAGGQAELVSFHYSDQLFLAYPAQALERSHQIMETIFTQTDLHPSDVVFCQEGQFGVGMGPFALQHGRRILVLSKNLFKYQHLDSFTTAPPLFRLGDARVVLGGRGVTDDKIALQWNFFDDGELLATGGASPYQGTYFQVRPEAVAAYEQELLDAEAAGFQIATVGQAVRWAEDNGVRMEDLPPMLDGTWQPQSTDSMHQWMGASGLPDVAYHCERDNGVLTGNVRAIHRIATAELLSDFAGQQGWVTAGQFDARLLGCWRKALLGQVSDGSGINPFVNEIHYSLEKAAEALSCADEVIAQIAPRASDSWLRIDLADGLVTPTDDRPGEFVEPAEALFGQTSGFAIASPGRQVTARWERVGLEDPLVRLTVRASLPEDGQRELSVTFPWDLSGFAVTPGLDEGRVAWTPLDQFDIDSDRITLPLANGLTGLASDLWLIKQTDTVHIGATFRVAERTVSFEEQTLDPEAGAEWVFWLVTGDSERALAVATRLNTRPQAWVETGVEPERGCACGGGSAAATPGLWIALALLWSCRRFYCLRR